MHSHPDSFELELFRRLLLGVCVFFALLGLLAIASAWLPGQLPYPQAGLVFQLRLGSVLASVAGLLVAARWVESEPTLVAAAAVVVSVNFLSTLGVLFFGGGNAVIQNASFLIVFGIYAFLYGLFSRHQKGILVFGAVALGLTLWVYPTFSTVLYQRELTVAELQKYINEVVAFGIFSFTALLFLNNKVADSLLRRARETSDKLARLAYYDLETDLPNGLMLERQFRAGLADTLEAGQSLGLVGFRLEGLEGLHETKSLEFTSEVVRRVLRRLEGAVAGRARALYRLERNVFLALVPLPGPRDPDLAFLSEGLAEALAFENASLPKASSLRSVGGFTVYPDDSDQPDQLLRNLLNTLHHLPTNAGPHFLPVNRESYERYLREQALKESLATSLGEVKGGLGAAFQPKVALGSRRLVGFEALARWSHPTYGAISPAEFIPLAGESGQMESLTVQIVRLTLGEIAALRKAGLGEFRVSFNLPPEVLNPSFLTKLGDQCEQSGLATFLEVEITEGTLMVLSSEVSRHFQRLRSLGVTFAIDDFGTGYSNLGYLQNFEADVLKIDKRFVDGIPHDEKNGKLVAAIVQMAKSFGMEVVAEGVEHTDQVDFLASVGCDVVQGYVFSRPLSAEGALAFAQSSPLV